MRVRVKHSSYKGVPKTWLTPPEGDQSQIFLTLGKECEVHAISGSEHGVSFCVIDDMKMFTWKYAWMFDVLDGDLPQDWIVRTLSAPYEQTVVIGPAFLSESVESYEDFVQQVPQSLRFMWDRWEQIQRSRTDALDLEY